LLVGSDLIGLEAGKNLNRYLIGDVRICFELARMMQHLKMSLRSTLLALIFGVFGIHPLVEASNMEGGSISYTRLADSSYNIRLLLYEECGAFPIGPFHPNSTSQLVYVRNKCGSTPAFVVLNRVVYPGVTVSNKCADSLSACEGGLLKGTRYHVFEGNYRFPVFADSLCNEWYITYGQNSESGWCCHVSNATLTFNPLGAVSHGQMLFYLQSYLNNHVPNGNSSGELALTTTPYFCVNWPVQFNVEWGEPDGDSLAYALVPVLVGFQTPAFYQTGKTPIAPLFTVDGVHLNPHTGEVRFTSPIPQVAAMVIERREYRNGILVGAINLSFKLLAGTNGFCNQQLDSIALSGCDSVVLPNGQIVYASGTYNDSIVVMNACDTLKVYEVHIGTPPTPGVIDGPIWTLPGSSGVYGVGNFTLGLTYEWEVVGGQAQPSVGPQTTISWGPAGMGTVRLNAYIDSFCVSSSQMNVDISGGVGVAEQHLPQPIWSPNPANNSLNIEKFDGLQAVRLCDAQGKLLQSWAVIEESLVLDVSRFPAGLYHLGFETEKGVRFEKLVILR
jgi:hypothetical protein